MRKLRYVSTILVGWLSLMLLSGCVHEFPCATEPDNTAVKCYIHLRYDLGSMPLLTTVPYNENGAKTRSATAPLDFRYLVRIMDDDDTDSRTTASRGVVEEICLSVPTPAEGESVDRTFEVSLPAGSYSIVAWSDFVDAGSTADKYYLTDDMRYITILTGADGAHPGATEGRQAFRGGAAVSLTENSSGGERRVDIYVDMERPMAKFRFIATDVNEFLSRRSRGIDGYYAVVNYPTYMPNVFNARLDRPTDSRQGQSFRSEIVPLTDGVAELGFDYVFVNHNDASVQLSIDIYERGTNRRMSSSDIITAPLRRNHVTEIRGRFFTTDARGGVGVDPGFNGDYNVEIK